MLWLVDLAITWSWLAERHGGNLRCAKVRFSGQYLKLQNLAFIRPLAVFPAFYTPLKSNGSLIKFGSIFCKFPPTFITVQYDLLTPSCQNLKKFVNCHNSLLNFWLFQILAGGWVKIIQHNDRSGGNLLKKMPNFTKLPLLFNGLLGFETSLWAYYSHVFWNYEYPSCRKNNRADISGHPTT